MGLEEDLKRFNNEPTVSKSHKTYSEYGVYGIYLNNELVYIGMTTTAFEQRFQEHRNAIKNQYTKIYQLLFEQEKIDFKPLIIFNHNQSGPTREQLKVMEFALITYLRPAGNTEGIDIDYRDFRKGWLDLPKRIYNTMEDSINEFTFGDSL